MHAGKSLSSLLAKLAILATASIPAVLTGPTGRRDRLCRASGGDVILRALTLQSLSSPKSSVHTSRCALTSCLSFFCVSVSLSHCRPFQRLDALQLASQARINWAVYTVEKAPPAAPRTALEDDIAIGLKFKNTQTPQCNWTICYFDHLTFIVLLDPIIALYSLQTYVECIISQQVILCKLILTPRLISKLTNLQTNQSSCHTNEQFHIWGRP